MDFFDGGGEIGCGYIKDRLEAAGETPFPSVFVKIRAPDGYFFCAKLLHDGSYLLVRKL